MINSENVFCSDLEFCSNKEELNNYGGEIRIAINMPDFYCKPSDSHLLISGRLTKEDGSAYAGTDLVSLGVMHLFSEIRYELNDVWIERIRYPGQATSMLTNNFTLEQDWLVKTPREKGSFEVLIPLRDIFGFCKENKIVYDLPHTLILKRNVDNEAIFKASTTAEQWLTLMRQWLTLMRQIEEEKNLEIDHIIKDVDDIAVPQSKNFDWRLRLSVEKPRYVIVAFQTGKENDQDQNPSIFDHCNVQSMSVFLNGEAYPRTDYDLDIENNRFARVFEDFLKFCVNYKGHCNITPSEWKNLYPFYVFDLRKQSERQKMFSFFDIRIRARFNQKVPANTHAFTLVLSERKLLMQSNGNNFNVVY